jgi:5-hydroxyisourate hydrolase
VSAITTHVLDVSKGRPAAGVPVVIEIEVSTGQWKELGRGTTDSDGRVRQMLPADSLVQGTYRLTFDTGSYFKSCNIAGLYPRVAVEFEVRDAENHYHIPLLLSPYGYSTYRGS